jgi:hypothetical protein
VQLLGVVYDVPLVRICGARINAPLEERVAHVGDAPAPAERRYCPEVPADPPT